MIITTSIELKELCQRLATHSFITVDTEFLREYTFYPQLCLIQVASVDEAVCIDPLAEGMDLTPFFDLMVNKTVVKVFHSARQDIENFYYLTQKIPYPLFDTQVAAMVLGFGDSVSYQQIVSDLLKVQIDKGMRYTDWSKRPLSIPQKEYALSDVTYLRDVYFLIKDKLEKMGRRSWIDEEMSFLLDPSLYNPDDEKIASKIKYNFKGEKIKLIYQDLYLWREHKARELNRPRRQILKDEILQELAKSHPKTIEEMGNLRGLPASFFKKKMAEEVLDVILLASKKEKKDFFPLPSENKAKSTEKNLISLLNLLLNLISVNEKTATKIIATQDELIDFSSGKEDVRFLTGWRYDVFGKYAIELKNGNLYFGYDTINRCVDYIRK